MIGNLIGNNKKAMVKVSKLYYWSKHRLKYFEAFNWTKRFAFVNKTFFVLTTSNYLDAKYKINLLRQLEKATCRQESGREEKTLKIQTWY